MVTMQDIAERANVSQATVSLALNGRKRVSETTRRRILRIAEELGYTPDPRLATLVERRWRKRSAPDGGNRLAVLVPARSKNEPSRNPMLPAIEERARQLGYGIDVVPVGDPLDYEKIVTARGIQGVLMIQAGEHSPLRDWHPRSLAVVQCGVVERSTGFHAVLPDLLNAGQDLCNRLRESRYRRIGFGTFADRGSNIDMLRQAAIGLMRAQLGDRCLPDPIFTAEKMTKEEFPVWVREHQPDLVVGMNDFFPGKLEMEGWKIPEQIGCASLMVSDGNEWITGYRANSPQVGRRAVEMVAEGLARLEFGTPSSPEMILVGSQWNPGRSMDLPAPAS